jgi:hypothetical protein
VHAQVSDQPAAMLASKLDGAESRLPVPILDGWPAIRKLGFSRIDGAETSVRRNAFRTTASLSDSSIYRSMTSTGCALQRKPASAAERSEGFISVKRSPRGSSMLPAPITPCLDSVATELHVTPPSPFVLASVQEQPATFRV